LNGYGIGSVDLTADGEGMQLRLPEGFARRSARR
jgi:hypothetical protein